MDSASLTSHIVHIPSSFLEIPIPQLASNKTNYSNSCRALLSAPPEDLASIPSLEFCHSTRVSTLPSHLRDYYCFSTIASLYDLIPFL